MFIKELEHGLCTFDTVAGTVTWCGYAGSYVDLDEVGEDGKPLKAFVKAGLKEGQRVVLSTLHYDKKRDNFFCRLESSLACPERTVEEEPYELFAEQAEAYACAA